MTATHSTVPVRGTARTAASRSAASSPIWNGHAKAVAKAFKEAGFEYTQDQNAEFKDGYFPITISNLYDRRVSAAIGYLDSGTRLRDNLTCFVSLAQRFRNCTRFSRATRRFSHPRPWGLDFPYES
jgi:hypothetical protein